MADLSAKISGNCSVTTVLLLERGCSNNCLIEPTLLETPGNATYQELAAQLVHIWIGCVL
jgi:hypothetical protein